MPYIVPMTCVLHGILLEKPQLPFHLGTIHERNMVGSDATINNASDNSRPCIKQWIHKPSQCLNHNKLNWKVGLWRVLVFDTVMQSKILSSVIYGSHFFWGKSSFKSTDYKMHDTAGKLTVSLSWCIVGFGMKAPCQS